MCCHSSIGAASAHAARPAFPWLMWIQSTLWVLDGVGKGKIAAFSPPHTFPAVSSSWHWQFSVSTLLIGPAQLSTCVPTSVAMLEEPGRSWEHHQALVLVPFYPCFLIHFFSCTYTRVKTVFLELSGSTAFQAWGFFNVTSSKVLPILPCRADASGAEWQHPHTPGLVPFLYQPCGDIQAVGTGTVWDIPEEHSQMEAGGWSPQLGFGIKCDFFLWSRCKLDMGTVVALPGSKASSSYGGLSAWWKIMRKVSQGIMRKRTNILGKVCAPLYLWTFALGWHRLSCCISFQNWIILSLWLRGLT